MSLVLENNPMNCVVPSGEAIHQWVFDRLPLSLKQKQQLLADLKAEKQIKEKEREELLDELEHRREEHNALLGEYVDLIKANEKPLDLLTCTCEEEAKVAEPQRCLKCFISEQQKPNEQQTVQSDQPKSDIPVDSDQQDLLSA
jgi:hypothetical protein